jgi:hypothetical protein
MILNRMSIFDYEGTYKEDEATFFSLSGEYLEAAEILLKVPPTKVNYWIVTYYLLGHSAELSLKSFLFKQNVLINKLRKIGHDLNTLISECHELGLPDFVLLRELSQIYKEKGLEYRKSRKEYFPCTEGLISEVKHLRSIVFAHVSKF